MLWAKLKQFLRNSYLHPRCIAKGISMSRIAFVTNICPHYRVKTFEILAHCHDVDYFFFSSGDEWYWQQQHGVQAGNFHYEYLPGIRLGQTRVTPALPWKLWRRKYDAYIK